MTSASDGGGADGGEVSDARGAHQQVILEEEPEYKDTETWISLPRNRRPKSWDKFNEPVCLLKRNLYGHPLAGLFWEKKNRRVLLSLGMRRNQKHLSIESLSTLVHI